MNPGAVDSLAPHPSSGRSLRRGAGSARGDFGNEPIRGRLTFAQKAAAGFACTVALAMVISGASYLALKSVIDSNHALAFGYAADVTTAKDLRATAQQTVAISRGFLITRDPLFIGDLRLSSARFHATLSQLRTRARQPEERRLLAQTETTQARHERYLNHAIRMRMNRAGVRRVGRYFNDRVMPEFDRMEAYLNRYVRFKDDQLAAARSQSVLASRRAVQLVVLVAATALFLACALAWILTSTLTRLYKRAEDAIAAREEVLAVVSHDLKNPLTSIVMSTELLRRRLTRGQLDAAQGEKTLTAIRLSTDRMRRLIDDLLDLSKMKAGYFPIEAQACDLREVLGTSRELIRPLAESKSIALEWVIDADLPTAVCDKDRVLQVLANLLGNAVKFTPSGGRIHLHAGAVPPSGDSLRDPHGYLQISVTDSGAGLGSDQIPRMFDRFWRANRSSKDGTGLGLAIAKGIITAHGGRIWADAAPGRGLRVSFSLPAAERAAGLAPPGLTRPDRASAAVGGADRPFGPRA